MPRVYDADLPEYAVAIDIYGDWARVQEYAPPRKIDPVKARRRLKEILGVLPDTLGIRPENIVLKTRRAQRGSDQYQKLADDAHFLEVEEGGLRFLVNLTDYLDTGNFLDHRLMRGMVGRSGLRPPFLNFRLYRHRDSLRSLRWCVFHHHG